MIMPSSRPPRTNSLDEGWALIEDDSAFAAVHDTRTLKMRSPVFEDPPTIEEKASDERDTVPPPVPVAEYVQTMMEQAPNEPDPSPSPLSWRNGLPPSSRRGASFLPPPRRPDFPPASTRVTRVLASVRAPAPPPAPPPDDDDDDVSGAFNLMAFEPEPLGAAPVKLEEPHLSAELTRSLDFDELSFDNVLSASDRAAPASRAPTPVPVVSSSRAEPPAAIPPILDIAWATSTAQRPSELPSGLTEPLADVRELYEAGDFRSALVMAEALLETEPDHVEARSYAARCRETLLKKYLGRLGGPGKILRVAMPPDEIRWLALDHKAGFLLACVDGISTIEEVLDVSCMQAFEAIRILHDFRELGVVEILPSPRSPRR